MATCSKEMIQYMHRYLDGDIEDGQLKILKAHLDSCEGCSRHFFELKKTIALVQSASHIQAPVNFTSNVLNALPKERKKVGMERWFRHHPFMTAAALFLFLMSAGFFSMWQQEDDHFAFTKHSDLQVEDHTVVVPKGETINGDIVVKNGDIRIEGEVEGDVTVINGEKYMASAGKVTGEIEEIDEMFGWLWFELKTGVKELFN
ncbi:anti-sigma factor RsiW [Bacillus ectoiniformans]|uniref:anti-sigma factor family protein n=1 Tax=Bacillus ectoiniformans TaxID=1494429 RepID=UPI00195DC05F|nr:anti-sigma factor [Bacillus ectoiniformans]MBM7649512.1 anti-sigma factor RsiW [Bacillus ectoiniformans]